MYKTVFFSFYIFFVLKTLSKNDIVLYESAWYQLNDDLIILFYELDAFDIKNPSVSPPALNSLPIKHKSLEWCLAEMCLLVSW